MIIPPDALSSETLSAILEEYASRDGTDYGEVEYSLADKVRQLHAALKRGEVVIVWSEMAQQVNLMSREEWNARTDDELY
ncbi:YheU family protein [Pokkaliibacter sp. CJK22405]|uniref:YheU family protein n=1 Tax=Pokkaliibacter sp. CJK22405 TaxID=3384615 RepID=UPI00398553C7